ncbi:MAG: transcriptional regulator GcvA [Burkholderiales bacterium]|nr:transcriptional regulator GcvA [Burkholderiales bacterium]
MAKRLPPLNPLRAFEAAARHGSVSRAAAELHVTHSAVSHQIRALEMTLKAKLFYREGRALRLSPQGAALLPPVSAAFDSIAEATTRVARPSSTGDLVVSCVPALLSFLLVPNLAAFAAAYPGVRLRLSRSNADKELHAPDVDVNIRYGDGNWPDLWVHLLAPLRLFPVCSPTLVHQTPLRNPEDLANHVLLHADEGREWNTWLAASGIGHLARGRQHFLADAQLALEGATYHAGVALGDSITTSTLLSTGRLIAPFEITVPAAHSFYVLCRNELRNAPIVRAFVEWLFETIPHG